MKIKWCVTGFLMLVLCAGVQLHAQQNDADRKFVEATKVKAENGDKISQCALAEWYANGRLGLIKDDEEAIKWYRKAAEQGFAEAQYNLGVCYGTGEGVTMDEVEAVNWYRKAADQRYAPAQSNLGVMYETGQGVAKNYTEAVKWYRKAAEQGDATAQCNLAGCYYFGKGILADYAEAYKWNALAAAQGHEKAVKGADLFRQTFTPNQIAEGQRRAAAFVPRNEIPSSTSSNSTSQINPSFSGTGFFITEDGYLISNYHVVKDAVKVRLVTSAGLIDAKVVSVDAANDLALLKADGRFAPLPIAASRTVNLGGTVATIGFPNIGLQGFAPKLAKGEIASLSGAADDPRYFQSACRCRWTKLEFKL